jgi:RimJ/RimL family protein N-acetyltransferase
VSDGLAVRQMRAEEWAPFKRIRLEMLNDTPTAFLERPHDAEQLGDSVWQERANALAGTNGAAFCVDSDGEWVGFVAVSRDADDRQPALIHAMYLRPTLRNGHRPFARELLEEAHRWATRDWALRGTRLWVRDDNHRARRRYLGAGWQPTGQNRPYVFDPMHTESEMQRLASAGG